MREYTKYSKFTENDFMVDPYFQEWIINPDAANSLFWDTFFKTYPHKKEAAEKAGIFLKNLAFKEDFPDENVISSALASHLRATEQETAGEAIYVRRKFPVRRVLAVAATFGLIFLAVLSLLIFVKRDRLVSVRTDYGKTRSVLLPDSSLVILNANSTIRFSKEWSKSNNREVWLKGEAFFDVKHINRDTTNIQNHDRFVVHTEDLTVEVLGTSFDVRQRRGKTEIVLQTGRIKVLFRNNRKEPVTMNPGDMLAYFPDENKLTATTTSAENFSAWKEKKLLLDDPSAAEIVQYLEDNFGKRIILENPELGKRKIEGSIILTNLDDALFVLSTVLNTQIIKRDSMIIMRPR